MRCVCGCGQRAVQQHHVIYRQELRHVAKSRAHAKALMTVRANLVPMAAGCHAAHHAREKVLPLHRLPDAVFAFAKRELEPGPAYEYLRRRYAGEDHRLNALLEERAA